MKTPEEIRKHVVDLSEMAGQAGQQNGPEEGAAIALIGVLSLLGEIAAQLGELNEVIKKKGFSPTVYAQLGEAGLP